MSNPPGMLKAFRPALESLDGRIVPATFTVTNLNDAGIGSLSAAVDLANANPDADTIVFQPGLTGTLTLTGGQITIAGPVNIQGPGAAALTISGNNTDRIFTVDDGNAADVTVTISGLTLTGGNGGSGAGGAINNNEALTLTDAVLTGNAAGLGGGVLTNGPLTVRRSTLSNNTAGFGGGIVTAVDSITIEDSTLSGNAATAGDGGGVGVGNTGLLTIRNSTITGNTATGNGGGVFSSSSTTTITSTILANNTAGTAAAADLFDSSFAFGSVTVGTSLIGTAPAAGTITTDAGGNLIGVDPLLGPLQNNGGQTPTHALLAGSPALNAGSNPLGLATDQRGTPFVRTFGPGTDIGAFEVQPTPTTTSLSSSAVRISPAGSVTLTATVTPTAGSTVPTGTVEFVDTAGGIVIDTVPLVNGVATLTASGFPIGSNPIIARYLGDSASLASQSATVSITVSGLSPGAAAGAGRGGGAATQFNPGGSVARTVAPFGDAFAGGVRVATGDFNADGVTDLVVGTGPGVASDVRVIDGATGGTLFQVNPFEASFLGGVFVAAGDITGDGLAELVITPDQGGGPRVQVYTGAGFGKIADFLGIDDPAFRGGARAGLGDVNGDGLADLVVSAGFLGGPRVAVFDGASIAGGSPTKLVRDFFAFEDTLRNGAFVAVADVNGDGFGDVIAGAGPGGGPRVVAFSGADLLAGTQLFLADFFVGDPANRNGVPVAVADFDGDGNADLLAGTGEPPASSVSRTAGTFTVFPARGLTSSTPTPLATVNPFPDFFGGIFVG